VRSAPGRRIGPIRFSDEAGLAVEPSLALDSAATVPFAIPGGLGRRRTGQNLLRCNTSKSDQKWRHEARALAPSDARSRTIYSRDSDAELDTVTANSCAALSADLHPPHASTGEGHRRARRLRTADRTAQNGPSRRAAKIAARGRQTRDSDPPRGTIVFRSNGTPYTAANAPPGGVILSQSALAISTTPPTATLVIVRPRKRRRRAEIGRRCRRPPSKGALFSASGGCT
jgi:hypothetical protein